MRFSRWLFVLGLIVGLAALVVAIIPPHKPDAPERNDAAPGRAKTEALTGSPAALQEELVRPEIELPENAVPLVVDSYAPDEQARLDGWRTVADASGHFDRLAIIGRDGRLVAPEKIQSGDVLVAQGWAGEGRVGIRHADVLLAMCDRVVARAQVSLDRPDVARAVHPHLLRSGWEAVIAAADLPTCADRRLSAWAVVRGNPPFLAPLIGMHQVTVEPENLPGRRRVSAQTPVSADTYARVDVHQIEIDATRVNLRRCGDIGCARVAQLVRGAYASVILERSNGWSLVAVADRIGWISDDLYRAVE